MGLLIISCDVRIGRRGTCGRQSVHRNYRLGPRVRVEESEKPRRSVHFADENAEAAEAEVEPEPEPEQEEEEQQQEQEGRVPALELEQ